MNCYIVMALYNNKEISYISNTSPILWADDIKNAKKYDSFSEAKFDLEDDFIKLVNYICAPNTNINSIWIVEYRNNEEIGRERFI